MSFPQTLGAEPRPVSAVLSWAAGGPAAPSRECPQLGRRAETRAEWGLSQGPSPACRPRPRGARMAHAWEGPEDTFAERNSLAPAAQRRPRPAPEDSAGSHLPGRRGVVVLAASGQGTVIHRRDLREPCAPQLEPSPCWLVPDPSTQGLFPEPESAGSPPQPAALTHFSPRRLCSSFSAPVTLPHVYASSAAESLLGVSVH